MNTGPQKFISLLGYRCKDKITGIEGVITSISFDLYGCIQAVVDLGLDKDGNQKKGGWYDVGRLTIISKKPVMEQPDFHAINSPIAEGKKGPAEKPSP
jgi:hypothetical protein